MHVHVSTARCTEEESRFVPSSEPSPQEIASRGDPPAAITTAHDQCTNAFLAHLQAGTLCCLVGSNRDGLSHIPVDWARRRRVREVAADTNHPHGQATFRDDQVLNAESPRDAKGFGYGNVRNNRDGSTAHDVRNTHTRPPLRIRIGNEYCKQARCSSIERYQHRAGFPSPIGGPETLHQSRSQSAKDGFLCPPQSSLGPTPRPRRHFCRASSFFSSVRFRSLVSPGRST